VGGGGRTCESRHRRRTRAAGFAARGSRREAVWLAPDFEAAPARGCTD